MNKWFPDKLTCRASPEFHCAMTLAFLDQAVSGAQDQAAIEAQAEELLDRLVSGEDFAALAMEASQDGSASRGGDLGFFAREQMVERFSDAAFELQPGQISGLVRTRFGLHIIKVEDRRPAQTVPEEVAADYIRTHLSQVKSEQKMVETLASLRAAATIEIIADY